MENFLPGLIMGFREGLEAFLIVVIILQYLRKSNNDNLRKHAYAGALTGVGASLVFGGILYLISKSIDRTNEVAKIWEGFSSIAALLLVTTFIYWMIKNGTNMVKNIHSKVKTSLSAFGIFSISFIMIVREGAEISIFTFAGKYTLISIFLGILAALLLSVLIYFSLVRVNLKVLFNITLAYLILQAGFLLGYGIHETLSALKSLERLPADSFLLVKLFDLSGTVLNHKEGIVGLPLYAAAGWYSKPEIIQFVLQYTYTGLMFLLWRKEVKRSYI